MPHEFAINSNTDDEPLTYVVDNLVDAEALCRAGMTVKLIRMVVQELPYPAHSNNSRLPSGKRPDARDVPNV